MIKYLLYYLKIFRKFGQDNEFFNELCYGYNFWHNFVSQLDISQLDI